MKSVAIKRAICITLVAAIAIATGIITGKAIVGGGATQSQGAFISNMDIGLPEQGKTPKDYSATDNFLFANKIMMQAKYVQVSVQGVTVGESLGVKQNQSSYGVKKAEGSSCFIDSGSKSAPGAIVGVNVGMRAYVNDDGTNVMYFKRRDNTDNWGDWTGKYLLPKESEDSQKYSFVSEYGYHPRQFIPYLVKTKDLKTQEVLDHVIEQNMELTADGNYVLTFTLHAKEAAKAYANHVLKMSNSAKFPEYSTLTMQITLDANWRILQAVYHEVYSVKQMGMDATCTADTTEQYQYNNIPLIAGQEKPE